MTYRNLVNYTFVSRIETFIFFFLLNPSRIQKLCVCIFMGNIVIYVSSVRICSPRNGTQLETGYVTKALTGMSYLRDKPRLGYDHTALRN